MDTGEFIWIDPGYDLRRRVYAEDESFTSSLATSTPEHRRGRADDSGFRSDSDLWNDMASPIVDMKKRWKREASALFDSSSREPLNRKAEKLIPVIMGIVILSSAIHSVQMILGSRAQSEEEAALNGKYESIRFAHNKTWASSLKNAPLSVQNIVDEDGSPLSGKRASIQFSHNYNELKVVAEPLLNKVESVYEISKKYKQETIEKVKNFGHFASNKAYALPIPKHLENYDNVKNIKDFEKLDKNDPGQMSSIPLEPLMFDDLVEETEPKDQSVPVKRLESQSLGAKSLESQNIPIKSLENQGASIQSLENQSIPLKSSEKPSVTVKTLESQNIPIKSLEDQIGMVKTFESQSIPVQSIENHSIPVQSLKSQRIPVQSWESQRIQVQPLERQSIPVQSLESQSIPDKPLESQSVPIKFSENLKTLNDPFSPPITRMS